MENIDQNSSSESDSEEIVKGFTELSTHQPIETISVKKKCIGEILSCLQENRERLLKFKKERIRVSIFHRTKKGEAVSFEEYRKKLQGKFGRNYRNINFNCDCYIINLPGDIELAKEASKYSVQEIETLLIYIEELNENVLECLQNFLRSFAYTQIRHFYLKGYWIRSEIKEHGRHNRYCEYFHKVYPCSNFFEELRYAVSRATNIIEIDSLELSSTEFIQLVKAAKKIKELRFRDCKISFDSEFDFGLMEGCLIREIHIGYSCQVYDESSEYEECLMKIFCGILNCTNLIRSLKILDLICTDDLKEKMNEKAKVILGEEYSDIMPYLAYF